MHLIDSPGATISGQFTDGDAGAGVPATVLWSKYMNMLQAELKAILDAQGLTPTVGDDTQVLQAIQAMIGGIPATGNAIINGDFWLAQRTKSRQFSNASGTLSGYVCDRWLCAADTGTGTGVATFSRQAHGVGTTPIVGAPKYFLRWGQGTASVGAPSVEQRIENVMDWDTGKATFKIWLRATSSIDVTVKLTQKFGAASGGSQNQNIGTPGVFAVTTVWQPFTYTVDLPSISGKTLGTAGNDCLAVVLLGPVGQTFTLEMSRAQLEHGAFASEFQARPLSKEILLCQRYYEKSYELEMDPGDSSAGNMVGASFGQYQTQTSGVRFSELERKFSVPKFSTPTVTWYSPGTGQGGANEITEGIHSLNSVIAVVGTTFPSRTSTGYPALASAPSTNGISGGHWTAESEI